MTKTENFPPPSAPLASSSSPAWREIKTGLGYPPEGSSVEARQEAGLNRDATLTPRKSEGEKLRED